MARKYELITELYAQTIRGITRSPENWCSFLRTACYNYRLRFDEQVLLYAQRPDATAVLEIENWNRKMGRWVNRGATGIAVFDDEYNGRMRLKHYFDISDTHETKLARQVPLNVREAFDKFANPVCSRLIKVESLRILKVIELSFDCFLDPFTSQDSVIDDIQAVLMCNLYIISFSHLRTGSPIQFHSVVLVLVILK